MEEKGRERAVWAVFQHKKLAEKKEMMNLLNKLLAGDRVLTQRRIPSAAS